MILNIHRIYKRKTKTSNSIYCLGRSGNVKKGSKIQQYLRQRLKMIFIKHIKM